MILQTVTRKALRTDSPASASKEVKAKAPPVSSDKIIKIWDNLSYQEIEIPTGPTSVASSRSVKSEGCIVVRAINAMPLMFFGYAGSTATKSPFRRPLQYRAPSWSWASVDTEIKYNWPLESDRIVAEVVEVHVVSEGQDPCGRVKSGWAKVQAPLCRLEPIAERQQRRPFSTRVEAHTGSAVRTGLAFFDQDPVFPSFALHLDHETAIVLRIAEPPHRERIVNGQWMAEKNGTEFISPCPNAQVAGQ
ncbi:hypothetical protein B7463_g12420, partial [Scytalidium lignicola]